MQVGEGLGLRAKAVLIMSAAVLYAGVGIAAPESAGEKLPWGITRVDLDGDGRQDMIVRSWRENHNAHGFSVYDVFVWKEKTLHRVVLPKGKGGGYALSIASVQGADCVLRDVYLAHRQGRAMLILAERPLGQGYAAAETVTFSLLRVEELKEAVPGTPRFVLTKAEQKHTSKPYCDVDDAFRAEGGS